MILTDPSYFFNVDNSKELFDFVYQDTQLSAEILDYYQNQFAMAKFKGINFPEGTYRYSLEKLVNNKLGETFGDKNDAYKYVGMVKYLQVQYEVDKILEDHFSDIDYNSVVHNFGNKFKRMLENLAERPSTFTQNEIREDTVLANDRIVKVKKLYQYTKGKTIYYICDSILGPIKFDMPAKSPFRHFMDRNLENGVDIKIGYGKVRPNISYDTGIFIVEYWEFP